MVAMQAVTMPGCTDDASSRASGGKQSNEGASCSEPENPYNDDGGHDAGFKWAEENGEQCEGNSDSFNEGCAEFYRQRDNYEACEAKRRT